MRSSGVPRALQQDEFVSIREGSGAHRNIWSISESPLKSGIPFNTISAMMHRTGHISRAVEDWRAPKRTSGVRYQSVTTYKWNSMRARNRFGSRTPCVYVRRGIPKALARQESAILRFASLSMSRFCGFKSRWMIR